MHKLTVTLKQHTPLIHFQHDQEGATLRASEVKPKLDKFILTKLGEEAEEGYEEGIVIAQNNGWLIGSSDHPSLDYKLRIISDDSQNIEMNVSKVVKKGIEQKDEIGRLLYSTSNYPNDLNSIIMGNIGGRIKEDVLNFKVYENNKIIIITQSDQLQNLIAQYIFTFFVEHNMGNRTSKGFGSYTVTSINGQKVDEVPRGDWTLKFDIKNDSGRVKSSQAYKEIFYVINRMWKGLKKYSKAEKNSKRSVFLGVQNNLSSEEERIPSPLFFKPIITQKEDRWSVKILAILKLNVIDCAGAEIDDFYNLIDEIVEDINKSTEQREQKGIQYHFSNIILS